MQKMLRAYQRALDRRPMVTRCIAGLVTAGGALEIDP